MTFADFIAYLGVGTLVATICAIIVLSAENLLPQEAPYAKAVKMLIIFMIIALGVYSIGFAVGTWLGL